MTLPPGRNVRSLLDNGPRLAELCLLLGGELGQDSPLTGRMGMTIGVLAAISAGIAVAAGAFGAHGAAGPQEAEWLRTGGLYQLVHAVAALAIMRFARGPAIMLLAGAAIFAFTLYLMALGGPRWLGAVTPIGGSLLIVGWFWTAWVYRRG